MDLSSENYVRSLNIDRLAKVLSKKGYTGLFHIFQTGTGNLDEILMVYLNECKVLRTDPFPVHVECITQNSKKSGAIVKCGFNLERMMSGLQPIQMHIKHYGEGGAILQSHEIKLYNENQIPSQQIANKIVSLDFSLKNFKRIKF